MVASSRYDRLIEAVFLSRFSKGAKAVDFEREDIVRHAAKLGIKLPKNLGDVVYSFRYRKQLPDQITKRAPKGRSWVILPVGKALYRFEALTVTEFVPNAALAETRIPDATPGVISMYALSDEQALLAKLRYNRLVDVFTRVTCYSLQSHLRTSVPDLGQVETDELYVGLDRSGAHYMFPVQAKGGKDKLGVVQVYQDYELCAHKFPSLTCRPIGAQFMRDGVIAMFEFERKGLGAAIVREKHYRLVAPEDLSAEELDTYRRTEAAD
jgi:hypothetical protein